MFREDEFEELLVGQETGTLTESEASRLAEYLAWSVDYRQMARLLSEVSISKDAVPSRPAVAIPAASTTRIRPSPWRLAAAAALLIGLGGWMLTLAVRSGQRPMLDPDLWLSLSAGRTTERPQGIEPGAVPADPDSAEGRSLAKLRAGDFSGVIVLDEEVKGQGYDSPILDMLDCQARLQQRTPLALADPDDPVVYLNPPDR